MRQISDMMPDLSHFFCLVAGRNAKNWANRRQFAKKSVSLRAKKPKGLKFCAKSLTSMSEIYKL
jgi:hypothetical protein